VVGDGFGCEATTNLGSDVAVDQFGLAFEFCEWEVAEGGEEVFSECLVVVPRWW
jgi:hypothetical protein